MHTSASSSPLVDEATRAAWARSDAERGQDDGAGVGRAGGMAQRPTKKSDASSAGRPKKAARAFKTVTVRAQGRRAVRLQAREGLTVGAALAEAADVLAPRKPVRARRASHPVLDLLYFGRPIGELIAPPGATCGDAAAAAAAALPGYDWHCVAPTAEGEPTPYAGARHAARLLHPGAPLAAALVRGPWGVHSVEVCARAPGEPLRDSPFAGAHRDVGPAGPAGRVVGGDWLRARGVRGMATSYELGPPPTLVAPADQRRWADPTQARRPGFATLDPAAPAPKTIRAVIV